MTMLQDGNSSHTAKVSQALASQLQIRLLWLPKRAPALKQMLAPGFLPLGIMRPARWVDIERQGL